MIQQAQSARPAIVAHRGVSGLFPENTRRAFEESVVCGADAIEFDIQLSADGHIVICHDPTLSFYGYPDTEVSSSTLEQLQSLDLGRCGGRAFSGERLLTLKEVLNDFGSRIPLYVEFKTKHMAADRIDQLVASFVQLTAVGRENWNLYGLCFDRAVLRRLRQNAAWLPLVWNTNRPHLIQSGKLAELHWLHAVGCRIGQLTRATAAKIHKADLQLFSFTCNTAEDILKARDLGVDSIITDNPEQTRLILGGDMNAAPVQSSLSTAPLPPDSPPSPIRP